MEQIKINKLIQKLNKLYPQATCALNYENELQLMVSVQLSAQCTDKRVNEVAKTLYRKYSTLEHFANANLIELEQHIKSTGFYHNKAKNIQEMCKKVIQFYNCKFPDSLNELLKLNGVGRKTANLFLWEIYKIPGIVVDTHMIRLTNLLGLAKTKNAYHIELQLMKIIPKEQWNIFCHQIVAHGRQVCIARRPLCDKCELSSLCEYRNTKESDK